MGDTQGNLRSEEARDQISSMGLRDAIEPCIPDGLSCSTYNRGSTVIYGGWVSGDIRVRAGGYLPFGKGLPTDHRCVWLDIDDANMLGYNMEPIRKSQARRLQCRNHQVRKIFEGAYVLHLQANNMLEQRQEVERWTLSQEAEWENIDELRLEGVDQAASKCRKLCIGNVDWCPTATQLRMILLFWSLYCHRAQGTKYASRSHHRRAFQRSLCVEVMLCTTHVKRRCTYYTLGNIVRLGGLVKVPDCKCIRFSS
jgi:hypothetical protein